MVDSRVGPTRCALKVFGVMAGCLQVCGRQAVPLNLRRKKGLQICGWKHAGLKLKKRLRATALSIVVA